MVHKALIATCLLIASGSVMASDGYVAGRVLRVEPSFSISFGGGHHNSGFRVLYETGGQHYWTHSNYRPHDVIYVPRPVHVQPVYYDNYYRGDRGHYNGWGNRDIHRSGGHGYDSHDGGRRGHRGYRGHD